MTQPAELLAGAVTLLCEQRFADVDAIAALSLVALSAATPRRSDLAIERHCIDLLTTTDPPLAGAGVVVAPYVLAEDPYWLEWWLAGPEGSPDRPSRLAVDLNPRSVAFRDYSTLSWFEEPRRTRVTAVTGPYVDYLCTDQYTLTFTSPLMVAERFVGVAGVDVLARWFEQHLLTIMDSAGHRDDGCVVVNRAGRVVACPSGDWVTGDLIRALGPDETVLEQWHVVPCAGTPFRVAREEP